MKLLAAKPLPAPVALPTLDEARAAANEAGAKQGIYACPVCGDSQAWKAFHETVYIAGRFKSDDGDHQFDGHKSITALCEECWGQMSPEERLPLYEARTAGWAKGIKSIIPGNARDAARHAAEVEAIAAETAVVRDAVLAGG